MACTEFLIIEADYDCVANEFQVTLAFLAQVEDHLQVTRFGDILSFSGDFFDRYLRLRKSGSNS